MWQTTNTTNFRRFNKKNSDLGERLVLFGRKSELKLRNGAVSSHKEYQMAIRSDYEGLKAE